MAASTRILIVDDDRALLEALRAALQRHYHVVVAHTGSGAREVLARQPVDLVLLDYFLPDGSGLVLLREIKDAYPALPVILMTAFGSEQLSVEFFRSGGRDYLPKPFKLPDLLNRIQNLLGTGGVGPGARAAAFLEAGPNLPDVGGAARAASLQRALAYIDAHFDAPLTLEQVSRQAGMSKFHFCRTFRDVTGLSFREFLARSRIARAAELLRDPNRSVADIYPEVGFKDPTHFGRVFRKLTGHSPSKYRRRELNPPDA